MLRFHLFLGLKHRVRIYLLRVADDALSLSHFFYSLGVAGTPLLGCTRCLSSLAFSAFHARRDGQFSRLFFCRFSESFVVVVTPENGLRFGGGCPLSYSVSSCSACIVEVDKT